MADSSILSARGGLLPKFASSPLFSENAYDRPESPSLSRRRTSIENLKKASRVKNSSMFAREQASEYDPTCPIALERPLASGRPLVASMQVNPAPAPQTADVDAAKSHIPARGHRRGESQNKIPLLNARKHERIQSEDRNTKSPSPMPSRNQPSPTKSSLSNKHNTLPRSFDSSTMYESEDDEDKVTPARPLRRQAKSVQFDTAPPQVNMYEAATPDPSSVASGSREGSFDRDDDTDEDNEMYDMDRAYDDDSFDASLEDTKKTPVVLPEDWRGMTPDVADADLVANFEDPFRAPREQGTPSEEWHKYRTASVDSETDSRPLPPVPQATEGSRRHSANILDRIQNSSRTLPSLPSAASVSKADILGMKDNAMSLEERLRLMGINDAAVERSNTDQALREKSRLQKHGLDIQIHEDDDVKQSVEEAKTASSSLPDFSFPIISREAILRKVQSRSTLEVETESSFSYDVQNLDPDVPIPSCETSHLEPQIHTDVRIKQEDDGSSYDLYSIPAMETGDFSLNFDGGSRDGSVIHHALRDPSESVYSAEDGTHSSSNDDDGPPTPRQDDVANTPQFDAVQDFDDALDMPENSLLDDSQLNAELTSFYSTCDNDLPKRDITPQLALSPPVQETEPLETCQFQEVEQSQAELSEPGSPQSVVHHPMPSSSPVLDQDMGDVEELGMLEEPETVEQVGMVEKVEMVEEVEEIPEPIATIKSPGGKLKTRPSLTPADTATMAATRRQVSGSYAPPVPDKSLQRMSIGAFPDGPDAKEKDAIDRAVKEHKKRRESFRSPLDLPGDSIGEDLSLDLDKEFDRVIESSKVNLHITLLTERKSNSVLQKGYLMRQNTKVVVAKRNFSNERTSSDLDRPLSADDAIKSGGAVRKPSHERAKSWTTEPWNGKARRRSLRSVDRNAPTSTAPPMPGQESAVGGLVTLAEDSAAQFEDTDDGVERGRLFVKVVGVKDLDLPLPKHERSFFQLTLDNGLHCVTTSKLELGRSAPIGQEFELIVLNDLEFQLTLQTQITRPAEIITPQVSPQKTNFSTKKSSTLSRFLASPKKRREQERLVQQQEDEERKASQRRLQETARRSQAPATAWDLQHELVGEDGSFGRAYISLKNHEDACFGRPITVDIPIFNEWAVEDPNIASSVKSKRGNNVRRRPPYQIGNLALQLLYVPRPKGLREEDMPKSMNSCVREMAAAETVTSTGEYEGFLSQQGGDCPVSCHHSTPLYKRLILFPSSGVGATSACMSQI